MVGLISSLPGALSLRTRCSWVRSARCCSQASTPFSMYSCPRVTIRYIRQASSRAVALTATAASFRASRARCRAPTKDWLRRAPTAAMRSARPDRIDRRGRPALVAPRRRAPNLSGRSATVSPVRPSIPLAAGATFRRRGPSVQPVSLSVSPVPDSATHHPAQFRLRPSGPETRGLAVRRCKSLQARLATVQSKAIDRPMSRPLSSHCCW